MTMFSPATKEQSRLRLALHGPSGSGKTYTGLALATILGKSVAVLDTEHGSANKYADEFKFQHMALSAPYTTERYIEGIRAAETEGHDILLIDSCSHEWDGTGGILQLVDESKARMGGNKFGGWAVGTPKHNSFVEAILASGIHVIATMRSKTEWAIDEKNKPIKIGLAPVQRDSFEYEFDLVGQMDMANTTTVDKSRIRALPPGTTVQKGQYADFAGTLKEWLSEGAVPASAAPVGDETVQALSAAISELNERFPEGHEGQTWSDRMISRMVEWYGVEAPENLTEKQAAEMLERIQQTVDVLEARATPAPA